MGTGVPPPPDREATPAAKRRVSRTFALLTTLAVTFSVSAPWVFLDDATPNASRALELLRSLSLFSGIGGALPLAVFVSWRAYHEAGTAPRLPMRMWLEVTALTVYGVLGLHIWWTSIEWIAYRYSAPRVMSALAVSVPVVLGIGIPHLLRRTGARVGSDGHLFTASLFAALSLVVPILGFVAGALFMVPLGDEAGDGTLGRFAFALGMALVHAWVATSLAGRTSPASAAPPSPRIFD